MTYDFHGAGIYAPAFRQRVTQIVSVARLATKFWLLILCGLYLPLLFPSIRMQMIESNVGPLLTTIGILYGTVAAHLIYSNSHLQKKANIRSRETISIAWMVGFFKMVTAMGIGLQVSSDTLLNMDIICSGILFTYGIFGYVVPYWDVSLFGSLFLTTTASLFSDLSLEILAYQILGLIIIMYFSFAAIERYFLRNRNTMYELDAPYYAVLSLGTDFVMVIYELFMDLFC